MKAGRGLVAWLPRVTWLAVAFALLAGARAAYDGGWTTDEPMHLEWSRRLIDRGITERRSALHFNSKTPVTVLNEVSRRFARHALRWRQREMVRFATRLPGLLWFGVVLAATFLVTRLCAGTVAAHLATQAVALDPNLIAHSALATVDTAYAAATLLTVVAALGFARRPGVTWGAALGLALGLAFSVKFTAFLLLPGVALLPLAMEGEAGRLRRAPALAGMAVALVAATTLICASYLFTGVAVPLGEVAWQSTVFTSLARAMPSLALPLPVDFLTGLDICFNAERTKVFNVVILGQRHPAGVFYYFGVAWLLKTPLLLLAALTFGLVQTLRERPLRANPALRYVALHLGLGLFYFSFVFRMQIGFRFVLMCVPLAAILAGAGLATLVHHRLFAPVLALVVLSAVAENAAYLGNSLAFTNAAVWPKRDVYRLLADSNVDYGQNHEKMAAWFAANRAPHRHLDPVHLLPGENILSFDQATGARGYPRHEWLREHLRPTRHFRHTYLFFEVESDDFERFLADSRRLRPAPDAEQLCSPGDPRNRPVDLQAAARFAPAPSPRGVELVCARVSGPADLALRSLEGEVFWGRADQLRKYWDRLREDAEVWYRLDPGVHAFVVAEPLSFRGEWIVRGGPVAAWAREARASKRRLQPWAPEPAPFAPARLSSR